MKEMHRRCGRLEILQSKNGNARFLIRIGRTAIDNTLSDDMKNLEGEFVGATIGMYHGQPTLDSIYKVVRR